MIYSLYRIHTESNISLIFARISPTGNCKGNGKRTKRDKIWMQPTLKSIFLRNIFLLQLF